MHSLFAMFLFLVKELLTQPHAGGSKLSNVFWMITK